MCTDLTKCDSCDKEIPCIGCTGCPDDIKRKGKENQARDKKKILSKMMVPRVGDKVFCLINGNGIVNDVYRSETGLVIEVSFLFGMVEYNSRGMLLCNTTGRRVLFHGHDLYYEIHEKEQEPDYMWVNVYVSEDYKEKIISKTNYTSESEARNHIYNEEAIIPGCIHIDTIQLKPKNETQKIRRISYNNKD